MLLFVLNVMTAAVGTGASVTAGAETATETEPSL